MSTNVSIFQQDLPDFLRNSQADALTKSLAGGGSTSKRLSIRGGAGSQGVDINTANSAAGGAGGSGKSSSASGSAVTYAGGGGGGNYNVGGGNAPSGTGAGAGGGGGYGADGSSYNGVSGASGTVIIRYISTFAAATSTTGSPTITVAGGYRVYSWTASGSITF